MVKTSIKFFVHAIHLLLRNILIFVFVLFLILFIWLKVGIRLDKVNAAHYNVNGLYIKLDKKLTLIGDNIVIPQSESAPSFENIDKVFDTIKFIFTFFDYIELKNVKFNNNQLTAVFSDDILYMTTNDYEVAGNIQRAGQKFEADISLLYLKEDNINIIGKLTYDFSTDDLWTQGNFDAYTIKGRFFVNKVANTVECNLDSDVFSDLHPLINKFNLEESVKVWILDKVEAQSYQVLNLNAKGIIKDKRLKMDWGALKAKVLFGATKIHFKENIEPVLAPGLILTYRDDGLYFDLQEPTYEGRSLEGSKVSIVNIRDANTTLKLDIKLDTPFDETMQNLLKSYSITMPVFQESGTVNGIFHADIGLKNDYQDFVTDINFTQGVVQLAQVKLPLVEGKLHYEKGFITVTNIVLKDSVYEGILKGKIDLKKQKADLLVDAKTIQLGNEKEKFFILKDQIFPVALNFKENLKLDIPKFSMKITSAKEETSIQLSDLNKIKMYLAHAAPIEEGGNLEIKTKDFKAYTFNGLLKRASCVLYTNDGECETRVPFRGTLTPEDLEFYAFGERVQYNKEKSRLTIQSLNIDLEKFLKIEKKYAESQEKKLHILGKKSNLRYGQYTLLTDSYDIEIQKNGDIEAIGSSDGDTIKFSKTKDIVSIQALRIKDKVLHPLINFDGLKEGRYTWKTKGEPGGTMNGEIMVEGGVMKDFKAYNNTLAFVNTLPALVSLHNPGFSQKGFAIKKGVVAYRMIERKKIIIDSVHIEGAAATIVGRGELDLENKTINMDLAIQVAGQLGKAVGSVPLLGYILTGEDKSITVGLKITGSLDKPIVKTSAAKQILTLPLGILKRTLESPGNIINR